MQDADPKDYSLPTTAEMTGSEPDMAHTAGQEIRLLRTDISQLTQERDYLCAGIDGLRAENQKLRAALERVKQGYLNILDFRRIAGTDRYGNLTRNEIEKAIDEIDAALAGAEGSEA